MMVADYMEAGFLENIIDMFRHDSGLYSMIGDLIQDERVRVRIGITALIEELKACDAANISDAVPSLLPLLSHEAAVVRGDASNLLGIIGNDKALHYLENLLKDPDENVRLLAKEAIADIREALSTTCADHCLNHVLSSAQE
ncbi:MAG: HEAT repeat domain-containing protein [Nitrospirae bacterium]|nr:HEAT repeat domain-containing protein [Nitrospirota bacterium]